MEESDMLIIILATVIGAIVYNIVIYNTTYTEEDPEDFENPKTSGSNYILAFFSSLLSIFIIYFAFIIFYKVPVEKNNKLKLLNDRRNKNIENLKALLQSEGIQKSPVLSRSFREKLEKLESTL